MSFVGKYHTPDETGDTKEAYDKVQTRKTLPLWTIYDPEIIIERFWLKRYWNEASLLTRWLADDGALQG